MVVGAPARARAPRASRTGGLIMRPVPSLAPVLEPATNGVPGLDVEATLLPDVRIVTPRRFGDDRGFFSEIYNASALRGGWHRHDLRAGQPFLVAQRRHRARPAFPEPALRAGQADPRCARPHPRRCGRHPAQPRRPTDSTSRSSSRRRTGGSSSCRSASRTASAPSSRTPRSSTRSRRRILPPMTGGLPWDDPDLRIAWPVDARATPCSPKRTGGSPSFAAFKSPF